MRLTEAEFQQFDNENAGYCSTCDEVTKDSCVEPDAEDYECPKCGDFSVMGMQRAIICGYLSFRQG